MDGNVDSAKPITTALIRDAMQSLCRNGDSHVGNAQLYKILGLDCQGERGRLRAYVNAMVKKGEVVRVSRAKYAYNFEYITIRKDAALPMIWRFVRMQKPGWSLQDACRLTGKYYAQIFRYCKRLEAGGYIARSGKDGRRLLFRATELAARTPETPYLATAETNPFKHELTAAARLTTLMLCHDPHRPGVAAEIVRNCRLLLERFDKNNIPQGEST